MRISVYFSVLLLLFCGGCASRQNVRPYFEAAVVSFTEAEKLERQITNEHAARQVAGFNELFGQLEATTLQSLRTLIISGWDNVEKDFKPGHRAEVWNAWIGEAASAGNEHQRLLNKLALAHYLDEKVKIDGVDEDDSSIVYKDEEVVMYDQYTKYAGKRITPSMIPLDEQNKEKLETFYGAWLERFEENVLKQSPVYLSVVAARKSTIQAVEEEQERKVERIGMLYESLGEMAELGMQQADTLTSNAGFIQLANKLFATANKLRAGESK